MAEGDKTPTKLPDVLIDRVTPVDPELIESPHDTKRETGKKFEDRNEDKQNDAGGSSKA